MNILEHLQAAKENGELVAIIYHGGSHPGEARRIYPVKVTETDVWGREENGTRAKCFKLEKIEIAGADAVIHDFSTERPSSEPETLAQALLPHLAEIDASSYVIEHADECVSVYRQIKNGNRRKHPFLSLRYTAPIPSQIVMTLKIGAPMQIESHLKGTERPWCVRSDRGTWSFKKPAAAVIRFMDEFRASQL